MPKIIIEQLPKLKSGGWIAGVKRSIAARGTEGVCTGDRFGSSSCPPGSRRYNLAKTFRKIAKRRKKQDGGEMQEEKWQAIIALTEQGIVDPAEIAAQLNAEGTYPTTPEEVQGYLDEYSQMGESAEPDEDYLQAGGVYNDYDQFQLAQKNYNDSLNAYNAGEAAWNATKQGATKIGTPITNDAGVVYSPKPVTVPNYTSMGNAPIMQMNVFDTLRNKNVPINRYAQPTQPVLQRATPRFSRQDGGASTMDPNAMNMIDMYSGAYNQASQDADVMGGLGNFMNAWGNMYSQPQMGPGQPVEEDSQNPGLPPMAEYRKYGGAKKKKKKYLPYAQYGENVMGVTVRNSDGTYSSMNPNMIPKTINQGQSEYDKYKAFYDQYNQGQYPAYAQRPNRYIRQGYNQGYFPANFTPTMRVKNKVWINGLPGGANSQSPFVSGSSAYMGPAGSFLTPGGWGQINQNYGRGFLGLGPNRLRSINYKWGTGDTPTSLPGKKTTWVGDKLREATSNIDTYGTPFPSKKRKEDIKDEKDRAKYRSENQSPVIYPQYQGAFGETGIPNRPIAAPAPAFINTGEGRPSIQDFIRQNVSPYTPEAPIVPQDPRLQKWLDTNPIARARQLQLESQQNEEFPGTSGYFQDGGQECTEEEKLDPLSPCYRKFDPNMTSYFDTTPEGYQVSKDEQFNQNDKLFGYSQSLNQNPFSASGESNIRFGSNMNGEDAANWGIAGLGLLGNIFSQDEKRNAEKQLRRRFKAENIFTSRQDRDRGDYTTNYGYFKPDQQNYGRYISKMGGATQYQMGAEVEMSNDEIAQFLKNGGQIEYI